MSWTKTTIGAEVLLQRGHDITRATQTEGVVPVFSSGGLSSYHDKAAYAGPGVILGRKGVVGSVWYTNLAYWPHDTTLFVRDFRGNHPRFVYYFFRYLAPTLATMDVGSANPTLNRNHVHPIETLWPDPNTQKRIAEILGALDDKIELNRRMNATLEEMARALFRSWFVDFDPVKVKARGGDPTAELGLAPEIAALFPDSVQDSPLGPIPTGWRASSVGQEFAVVMGQSPPGDTYNSEGEGLPFYQGKTDYGYRFPTRRIYCSAPTRYACEGDSLVSVRAPVGALNMAQEKCAIGRGLASVRHHSGSASLTYYAMHALSAELAVYEEGGTVFGSITKQGFHSLPFVAPPDGLIQSYEKIVGIQDSQIRLNEEQSVALAETRDYLLPRLLSGSIVPHDHDWPRVGLGCA